MSPFFSFFKKKDQEVSKPINKTDKIPKHSQDSGIISIDTALEKIKNEEENIVGESIKKLRKTCEETKQSFETIINIAEKI